jgi:hypothetical protein
MFRLRVQVERQVAHVLPTVGQEGDLLVRLHPLRLQNFEQAALWLEIVGLDKSEALRRSVRGHALTSDDLEPAVTA